MAAKAACGAFFVGAIGIHGGGSGGDWTLGYIALEDGDIEELWVATRIGTPVTILE